MGQQFLCRIVQIGAELRKYLHLAVLRQIDTQRSGYALHDLLTVRNGNDIRRNIRRYVSRQRFDDRKRRHGTAAVGRIPSAGTLQKSGMQVEYVARISLAARRSVKQERHGAVGLRVLREIVVDDQNVLSLIHEVLADGGSRIRGEILQRRRLAGRRIYDDGILHRAVLLQRIYRLGHRGRLLSDGHIDADDVLPLLVDDRIDGDGRLSRLTVSDDQLTLSPSDGEHGVDS